MFKNLTDRITSAILPAGGDREKIETIRGMGFTADQARNALDATGDGNVERALEMLLSQQQYSASGSSAPAPSSASRPIDLTRDDEDAQLQRAMEESLSTGNGTASRPQEQATKKASSGKSKGVASVPASTTRAGRAALDRLDAKSKPTKKKKQPVAASARTNGNAARPTPKITTVPLPGAAPYIPTDRVKAPAPLRSKSKEEQITRCASRLAPHPRAVDLLLSALTQLKTDRSNPRYRTIDRSKPAFRRALHDVPGAEDLLRAVNFRPTPGNPDQLTLSERDVDPALIWMACSALEEAKSTDEYVAARQKMEFARAVRDIQDGSGKGAEEEVARAGYVSKCPSEPPAGRGALMSVLIAEQDAILRRFDGDDTLRDVVNWIGGHGSCIPGRILSREWCLVDLNRFPVAPVPCSEADLNKTLQVIGCWPSGRLELRQSDEAWRRDGRSEVEMGAARGLGGAHHHH